MLPLHQLIHQNQQERNFFDEIKKKNQTHTLHGHFRKTIELDQHIDKKESQQWLQGKYLTSHFTAYACAVEEQEIATKDLLNKRQCDEGKAPSISDKC